MPTGNYAIYEPEVREQDDLLECAAEDLQALDANVLAWQMSRPLRRRFAYPYANREIAWLSYKSRQLGVKVEHRFNGRQKVIRREEGICYYPDGYVPELGLLLGYNSCYR